MRVGSGKKNTEFLVDEFFSYVFFGVATGLSNFLNGSLKKRA